MVTLRRAHPSFTSYACQWERRWELFVQAWPHRTTILWSNISPRSLSKVYLVALTTNLKSMGNSTKRPNHSFLSSESMSSYCHTARAICKLLLCSSCDESFRISLQSPEVCKELKLPTRQLIFIQFIRFRTTELPDQLSTLESTKAG